MTVNVTFGKSAHRGASLTGVPTPQNIESRPPALPGDAMLRRLLPPELTNPWRMRGGASKTVRSKAEPWNELKPGLAPSG